jgi:hypothetical protein
MDAQLALPIETPKGQALVGVLLDRLRGG